MNIGITANLDRNDFGEGLKQASINLYDCIRGTHNEAFYVCLSPNIVNFNKDHLGYDLRAILEDGAPKLDVLIFHGFIPDKEYIRTFKKKHPKCKFVVFHQGNRIAIDSASLFKGGVFSGGVDYADEIWMPPHHENSKHYLEAIHGSKCNARKVPFLWSPFFLNEVAKKTKYKDIKFRNDKTKGVVILEPNTNYSKNCMIPLMICDRLNRTDPKLIKSVSATNTEKIKEEAFFKEFYSSLSIAKSRKLFLSKRWTLPEVLSRWGQYVVSHTNNNELNYLHLECFHLGLPIIHNSAALSGCGYYYEEHDIHTAANQLKNALTIHAENLEDYLAEGRKIIRNFLPTNIRNINDIGTRLHVVSQKNIP